MSATLSFALGVVIGSLIVGALWFRWAVRIGRAMKTINDQYRILKSFLDEASIAADALASRARGLLDEIDSSHRARGL